MALALGAVVGLTGCTGAGASTPEELVKEYIAALNAGDYEKALSMVAEPGEVTAENILNFTGFEYKEPLLRGEPLASGAEAGTIGIDLDGTPVPVSVEKRDGAWKLSTPVALTAVDYTERFAAFEKFDEVGDVTFLDQNGDPITTPTGFSMLPSKEESSQLITVQLDGTLVPDQKVELAAAFLGDGWPSDEFDPGQLTEQVSVIADDLVYVDWHYDAGAQQYVTQRGDLAGVACALGVLETTYQASSGNLLFACSFDKPEKDLDGADFFRPAMSNEEGGSLEVSSRFDNKGGISVRDFLPCVYNTGLKVAPAEAGGDFAVRLEDGTLTVLWGGEERTETFDGESQRLDQSRISETCSGWDPAKEGSIREGLVPRASDEAGTTVAVKL